MNTSGGCRKSGRWYVALTGLTFFVGWCVPALAGDLTSTLCNNEVVSVGDRKGIVLDKCGPPLSKSLEKVGEHTVQTVKKKKATKKRAKQDALTVTKQKTVKERGETWTYNIDGSYRFFVFQEGKLARIETGGLAK